MAFKVGPWINEVIVTYLPNAVHPLEEHRTVLLRLPMPRVAEVEGMTKPHPLLLDQHLHTVIHTVTHTQTVTMAKMSEIFNFTSTCIVIKCFVVKISDHQTLVECGPISLSSLFHWLVTTPQHRAEVWSEDY